MSHLNHILYSCSTCASFDTRPECVNAFTPRSHRMATATEHTLTLCSMLSPSLPSLSLSLPLSLSLSLSVSHCPSLSLSVSLSLYLCICASACLCNCVSLYTYTAACAHNMHRLRLARTTRTYERAQEVSMGHAASAKAR